MLSHTKSRTAGKKLYLLLFLFFAVGAKAQWVSIPDTNFGTWLNTNGYTTCMQGNSQVGWQMDTSCPAVVNAVHVDCNPGNIRDLTGIQYFDNLDTLDCGRNNITTLPALPGSLTCLYCFNNQLALLPGLPGSLTRLACDNNQLTTLPPLPGSLTHLYCSANQLTALPDLPGSLGYLDCNVNQLSSIPALPDGLTYLYCNSNQLTFIPELPNLLPYFECENNPTLHCLPKLTRIWHFKFNNTGITCLPNYPRNNLYSNPPMYSVPICDAFNSNGCPVYWNISGKVYYDSNTNCISDTTEANAGNVKLQLWSGGNLVQQTVTLSNGEYAFDTDTLGVYSIRVDTTTLSFDVACPSGNILTDNLTSADSLHSDSDFGLACKPGFDLTAHSIWGGRFRPANFTTVSIHAGDFSNFCGVHCAAGVSGAVTVTINGAASYVSPASGALTPTVSGNVLTYNVADFGNTNFNTDFNIVVQTDTTAPLGSQVCFTVSVTPTTGDNNPANNTLTHCFTIVGSFDPNDKQVSPPAGVDTSGWLTYTVNFQNTGTDTAIHIYITDTLDTDLDESTFQLLAYSVQPMVQITGNAVRFNFPNINLPDSNVNEPLSHGYVQYKVKLQNGLPIGTQIDNTAIIYFDFNAPVVTNTVINTVTDTIPCSTTTTMLSADICSGSSYSFNGMLLDSTGVYVDSLLDVNGCDSLIELTLTVHPSFVTTINTSICEYEYFSFHGTLLNTGGVYYDTLTSVHGCDSVVELILTVLPALVSNISASICNNEQYSFGGMQLSASGVYYDSITNNTGCDSVIVLTLSVLSPSVTNITASVCPDEDYNFDGVALNAAGVYYDTLQAVNGCDSILELTLTVLSSSTTSINASICENEEYSFDGAQLNTAGVYYDTLQNVNGCDSVVTLQLDITDVNYTITYIGSDTLVFSGNGSVQWMSCGNGTVSADTSSVFGPKVIGAFAAIVTQDNCTDTSQCYMVGFDGINEPDGYGIKIYPNPATSQLFIETNNMKVEQVTILDATGKAVSHTAELNNNRIDISSLANGVYIAEIKLKEQRVRRRWVKM